MNKYKEYIDDYTYEEGYGCEVPTIDDLEEVIEYDLTITAEEFEEILDELDL